MKVGDLIKLKGKRYREPHTAVILEVITHYSGNRQGALSLKVMWENGQVLNIASPSLFEVLNEGD